MNKSDDLFFDDPFNEMQYALVGGNISEDDIPYKWLQDWFTWYEEQLRKEEKRVYQEGYKDGKSYGYDTGYLEGFREGCVTSTEQEYQKGVQDGKIQERMEEYDQTRND